MFPRAYTPCSSPLCELTKVMIKDLLETHHSGTYLLLRSITPPDRMTAVMVIAEDKKDVLMLQLYYQVPENKCATEEILGEGTILIVKEPYLKLIVDGDYGVRVDHLSDVIYLPAHDKQTPNGWQVTESQLCSCLEGQEQRLL
ncbi:hypothetical protein B0O99DRAFT_634741 [Bisporella sp. PMI_857]|nr:hypothetical protein B0O99DRAFT_634741 [Bisporella sp. PMI_857]